MKKTEIIPLIIREAKTGKFIASWPVKSRANVHGLGKPTPERLSQWRDEFNRSLLKGGANEHLGINYWLQCKLQVYNQLNGQIVCEFDSPMFEVIP